MMVIGAVCGDSRALWEQLEARRRLERQHHRHFQGLVQRHLQAISRKTNFLSPPGWRHIRIHLGCSYNPLRSSCSWWICICGRLRLLQRLQVRTYFICILSYIVIYCLLYVIMLDSWINIFFLFFPHEIHYLMHYLVRLRGKKDWVCNCRQYEFFVFVLVFVFSDYYDVCMYVCMYVTFNLT